MQPSVIEELDQHESIVYPEAWLNPVYLVGMPQVVESVPASAAGWPLVPLEANQK
jgi:hypothetical protein